MSAEFRAGLLDEAKGYVTKDRNSSYGEPEDNFANIAAIWNAQGFCFGGIEGVRPINAVDVALMMQGMKLARLKTNPTHRDSWVDGIGYGACGGEIALDVRKHDIEFGEDIIAKRACCELAFVTFGRGHDDECKSAESEQARDEQDDTVPPVGPHFCGNVNMHEPHSYSRASSGAVLWAGADYWCDGNPHVTHPQAHRPLSADVAAQHRERDIDVVKRVADKHALRDNERACEGKEPHHDCGPKPRPIKDAPQA